MDKYKLIIEQLKSLAEASNHYMPLLSNVSALLFENMENINWAGFYLVKDDNLILGPFQGKVACVNIEKGKGVCGSAFAQDKTLVVDDVHKFEGHIACDEASNSEIVIPIHFQDKIIGVLDIDGPIFNRFSLEDKRGLESVVEAIEEVIYFEEL